MIPFLLNQPRASAAFTRAITVSPGDVPTSRHQRSLARAVNDRLRFATDMPWRVAWAMYNGARLVRNPPSGAALVFPAEGEFWKHYQHLFPTAGDWPAAAPGEPEGANLGAVIPQFIFGNPSLTDEPDRIGALFPMRVMVGGVSVAATTPALVWALGASQRGYITADGEAYVPALEAAQTLFRFQFSDLTYHGKSFGGWQATPPVPDEGMGDQTCGPTGTDYASWPNRIYHWTAIEAGVSTTGLHGSVTTNGDGKAVVTYAGSCPCDAPRSAAGHILYVSDMPFAWYVYTWDGTTDPEDGCGVAVDRLDKALWVEGPYDGKPVPRHSDFHHILRTSWHYGQEFKGADSQRIGDGFRIEPIAFDAQGFWTRQYPLAPARAVVVGEGIDAVYPGREWSSDPGAGPHALHDEAGAWAPHEGFVICGFYAAATGLLAPVVVTFAADGLRRSLALTPDESGAAAAMVWLPDGVAPAALTASLGGILDLDDGGVLTVAAAELLAYRPQLWDQYLVTRCATASGSSDDPQGPDYTQAAAVVPAIFTHGAILGEYPADQPDEITGNPLYQAWRRLSRLVRLMPRESLLSYELADGVATLRFRREVPGLALGLDQADPWEGIAPPPGPMESGMVVRGEIYVVRGASGVVTYDGEEYGIGQEFTGTSAATFTATGDAAPWVLDGIRHVAPPGGWSNEWVFFLQTHVYRDADANLYKPSIYADFYTFCAQEHFASQSMDDQLKAFVNAGYSFGNPDGTTYTSNLNIPLVNLLVLNPEAPSAYTYAAGANVAADDAFRQSRQVYPRPYEVDSCTVEFSGGDQVVVLRLVEKLRQHPNAPAAVSQDPAVWSSDDLARLDNTHATYPEDFRTDDNAVREYLRYTSGDGHHCKYRTGDAANTTYGPAAPSGYTCDGACFPNFLFVKLVPECHEDGNDTVEPTDTRITADWMQHAALVVDCICEGFVAGVTSTERVCRRVADAGLYDYTREALYYEAFEGRSIPPISEADRADNPIGYGPLPNTRIYAETHNRLAACINLLTRLRMDLPLLWETRTRQWTGSVTPTLTAPDGFELGNCNSAAGYEARLDDAECPLAETSTYDSGWEEKTEAPVVLGTYGAGLDCCDGTSDWCLNSFRQEMQWAVTIHPDWLLAVPAHIRELVAVQGVGTVAVRTEQRWRHDRLDEDPRTVCDGVPQGYQWRQEMLVDTVECVLVPPGTVSAPLPPTGDVAKFKPTDDSEPCPFENVHSVTLELLAFPGAYVEVPLIDLP